MAERIGDVRRRLNEVLEVVVRRDEELERVRGALEASARRLAEATERRRAAELRVHELEVELAEASLEVPLSPTDLWSRALEIVQERSGAELYRRFLLLPEPIRASLRRLFRMVRRSWR